MLLSFHLSLHSLIVGLPTRFNDLLLRAVNSLCWAGNGANIPSRYIFSQYQKGIYLRRASVMLRKQQTGQKVLKQDSKQRMPGDKRYDYRLESQ